MQYLATIGNPCFDLHLEHYSQKAAKEWQIEMEYVGNEIKFIEYIKFQRGGKKTYANIPTKTICSNLAFSSKHEVCKLLVLSILNMLHRVKNLGIEGNTIFCELFKDKYFTAIYGDI